CFEPINYALIQTDGVPTGPPGTGDLTSASFTPNSKTLLMSSGDTISVALKETANGLEVDVTDTTTGTSGFMVASSGNGFKHASHLDCSTSEFSFHPLYDTAKVGNSLPGGFQSAVSLSFEIGHYEVPDQDADDQACFIVNGGCTQPDLDYDGLSYQPVWPDGSANNPRSIVIGGPSSNGVGPVSFSDGSYSAAYAQLQFKTSKADAVAAASFYPFFSISGTGTSCRLGFGNDLPTTISDFGQRSQYAAPSLVANPCLPTPTATTSTTTSTTTTTHPTTTSTSATSTTTTSTSTTTAPPTTTTRPPTTTTTKPPTTTTTTIPPECADFPCGDDEVSICHIPPGNPRNSQTLCIGLDSVPAHLNHGD